MWHGLTPFEAKGVMHHVATMPGVGLCLSVVQMGPGQCSDGFGDVDPRLVNPPVVESGVCPWHFGGDCYAEEVSLSQAGYRCMALLWHCNCKGRSSSWASCFVCFCSCRFRVGAMREIILDGRCAFLSGVRLAALGGRCVGHPKVGPRLDCIL